MASSIDRRNAGAEKVLECIKLTLLANMNGYPPQLAVEFGRKALYSTVRPSFMELEDHVRRSEEHTSELQSLMRISYAVFCLKNKKQTTKCYCTKHHKKK